VEKNETHFKPNAVFDIIKQKKENAPQLLCSFASTLNDVIWQWRNAYVAAFDPTIENKSIHVLKKTVCINISIARLFQ
jgi:hypothetical protein